MMFEIAGGSVAGKDHSRVGKNSQDSYHWEEAAGIVAAVVCDGCGSSPHSEVGAQLGAKMVAKQALLAYLQDPCMFATGLKDQSTPALERLRRSLLIGISSIANEMAGSFTENVRDYFLFTILGVIVDPLRGAVIFGCGDGVYYVNGVPVTISSPNNAPPYLSYGLVDTGKEDPGFTIHSTVQTADVKSILIGTDGVQDLGKSFDAMIPGKEEKIGSISQFWEKDGFFKNPFSIGHRLALINRSTAKIDWEKKALSEAHGPLRDDTTVIAIRRKKA